jgi:hypothetical protein
VKQDEGPAYPLQSNPTSKPFEGITLRVDAHGFRGDNERTETTTKKKAPKPLFLVWRVLSASHAHLANEFKVFSLR